MLPKEPRRVSIASLRECTQDHKVVLIPPWDQYRAVFVSKFLANADEGLLYTRMPDVPVPLHSWLAGLTEHLRSVNSSFGRSLGPLLQASVTDASQLAAALAEDLNRIATDPLLLFIDEFDPHAWPHELDQFLFSLVQALDPHVKIVLSSRMQSYAPINEVISSGVAVILGMEWRRNDLYFVVETQPKPQIEIYTLGRTETLVNAQEIRQWEGSLPKLLFYYLIDHKLVTRDAIFADFWPKVSTKDATDIFHVTKHKVTEVLSRPLGGRPLDLTQYTQGFYVPSIAFVRHYDVDDFVAAVERARMAEKISEREEWLSAALAKYRGPYLEGITVPWVVARREELARLHAEAQIMVGGIHAEQGRIEKAAQAYEEALKVLPLREDIQRELIRCYIELGHIDDARKRLAQLEDKVYKRMGLKPTPESQELRATVEALNS